MDKNSNFDGLSTQEVFNLLKKVYNSCENTTILDENTTFGDFLTTENDSKINTEIKFVIETSKFINNNPNLKRQIKNNSNILADKFVEVLSTTLTNNRLL